jgi:predicted nucleotidyltransferase
MTIPSSTRSQAAIVAHLRDVLESVSCTITHALLFGSVARDEQTPTSDVDVIIVSPAFEGTAGARRGRPLRDAWDYAQYGSVHFIPYTPAEYERFRQRAAGLISTAEEEGIDLLDPTLDVR